MPSITTWKRLEPRCRRDDFREALNASIHDPLWLLGRQWQFGEFRATDGGSPVIARFRAECSKPDRYIPGPASGRSTEAMSYDSSTLPLETLVEREGIRVANQPPLWAAAESGLQFLRLLDIHGASQVVRAGFLRNYPFDREAEERAGIDAASSRFLDLMSGRVPHGGRLYEALKGARPISEGAAWRFPAAIGIGAADAGAVAAAAGEWLQWYDEALSEPPVGAPTAWLSERLEYGFSVAARTSDGEVALTAQGYPGGRLDWHAFTIDPAVSLGATSIVQPIVQVAVPAPVTFRGMPSPRYWEFEDGQVDLGGIAAEPEDLTRLLLIEFALIYGNDWFLLPIELEVGVICRRRSLVVVDTFGERTLVRPYDEVDEPTGRWSMFHVAPGLFFLPPTLGATLESAPVEEVLFLRDEMANMAWAIERTVESRTGRPLSRYEAVVSGREEREGNRTAAPEPAPSDVPPTYRLMSEIPINWIPLVPQRVGASAVRLRRAAVARDGGLPPAGPLGRILEGEGALSLYEEEVPRAGARIIRTYHYARWTDGSTHVWIGRRKQAGRGEGSSGLRFDVLEDAE